MRTAASDLRRHQRVLVPEGHSIHADGSGRGFQLEGEVSVVGLTGIFLRTRDLRAVGTAMHLKVIGPLAGFEFDGAIRYVGERGVGVEIISITPTDQQKLKSLLLHLKA
ncbi:MAG: PilZ domain-containing protein [Candidatus Acidiferrales bacterium]